MACCNSSQLIHKVTISIHEVILIEELCDKYWNVESCKSQHISALFLI